MGLRETAMLAQVQLLPQASERQWRSRVQMALPDVGKQRGGPQAIHFSGAGDDPNSATSRAMLQLCVGLLVASAGTRNWPPTSLVPGEHAPPTEPDDAKRNLSHMLAHVSHSRRPRHAGRGVQGEPPGDLPCNGIRPAAKMLG